MFTRKHPRPGFYPFGVAQKRQYRSDQTSLRLRNPRHTLARDHSSFRLNSITAFLPLSSETRGETRGRLLYRRRESCDYPQGA
ncbi:MAG: hypothetical protein DDT37_00691 [Firmicutes bacterium]|nr:hypothetical protein [candidate division NPL-UPA2 bacterium]MBT9154697.1 hypothetical protein [candidate division NPL-UPA2 bacterium]MBT9155723.1 hypothetical protein [candidate division NPL-UPA2 bacterium]